MRNRIEESELALIEKTEGKSPQWHRVKILLMARGVCRHGVPRSTNPSDRRTERLRSRVSEFGEAVKALEATADPESGRFISEANQYIGKLRRLRQEYGQPTIKFTLDGSLSSLGTAITMMTDAARSQ